MGGYPLSVNQSTRSPPFRWTINVHWMLAGDALIHMARCGVCMDHLCPAEANKPHIIPFYIPNWFGYGAPSRTTINLICWENRMHKKKNKNKNNNNNNKIKVKSSINLLIRPIQTNILDLSSIHTRRYRNRRSPTLDASIHHDPSNFNNKKII